MVHSWYNYMKSLACYCGVFVFLSVFFPPSSPESLTFLSLTCRLSTSKKQCSSVALEFSVPAVYNLISDFTFKFQRQLHGIMRWAWTLESWFQHLLTGSPWTCFSTCSVLLHVHWSWSESLDRVVNIRLYHRWKHLALCFRHSGYLVALGFLLPLHLLD